MLVKLTPALGKSILRAAQTYAFLSIAGAGFAQTAAVPSQYQSLYSSVQSSLNTFSSTIHTAWNGSKHSVGFAAQLLPASSENGVALLTPGIMTAIDAQLTEFQALGVKAIDIHINFPSLYAPYYSDQTQYQQLLSFYTALAADIHGRGLTLIVESQLDKNNPVTNTWTSKSYVQSLSWTDYQTGRAQTAATIAQYVRPDYMTIISEPDTEANNSLQTQVGTVSGSVQMANTIIAAIQKTGASGTALGAGVGTWQSSFTSFMNAYAALPIQFLDVHIYSVFNSVFLTNALTAADIAHQYGKQIAMSEGWLDKISATDPTTGGFAAVEQRNVFNFWAPLDSLFLQILADMGNYKQYAFIAPSWTTYFFSYMPYASPAPTIAQDTQIAYAAVQQGAFTPSALAYEAAILPVPDTSAPLVPAPPSFQRAPKGLNVAWTATSDNVGPAGYRLYRNQTLVTTTSSLTFFDVSAASGTSYAYTIAAFDAAGNTSSLSASANSPK